MISVFAILALLATLICGLLTGFVYYTNRKGALNRVFVFAIALGAYTAAATFMMIQAESVETAYFWNKAGFLSPLFPSALLDFVLIFTHNRLAVDRRRYLLLYVPALLIALVDLTTDSISGPPVNTSYGYAFFGSNSPLSFLSNLWFVIVSVIAIVLCLTYAIRTQDETKKQQAKLITLALAYPITAGVLSKAGYFIFGWYIPYYGVGANAVLCIFIFFAIWKYNLLNVNPATAAENIIATMSDSFILTDTKGEILRVNSALTALLGYKEDELVGKRIDKLLGAEQTAQLLYDVEHDREIKNHEAQITTKNGASRPVSISASLIKSKKGKAIGITLIIHDLTRRKQNEEKTVKNERFATIGELAGMVGHDLRNPLNSIQVATYYIKKKSFNQLDSTSLEMLNTIHTSIQYSNKIINDLLDFPRDTP